MNSLPEKHRQETHKKIRTFDKSKIAKWMLSEGFYPEQFVLPPCLQVDNFNFNEHKYFPNKHRILQKNLAKTSFPKNDLSDREFAIMYPHHYHDLVWEIHNQWDEILELIFNAQNSIYTYSFPIPVNESKEDEKPLRSGRMIYEFLEMAEKDLVAEANQYSFIIRVDITNFYPSIYTHTLCWAWEGRDGNNKGREICIKKGTSVTFGNNLDKLFQYANDKRTVGIPIGPVVSDLIAEIILAERDLVISTRIKNDLSLKGQYLATRFKDDYRILCKSESSGKKIIKLISETLKEYNLNINANKTRITVIPHGLYRQHAVLYQPYSFRNPQNLNNGNIHFKSFENVLLHTLKLHQDYPGTSIIEKFLSELIMPKYTKNSDGNYKKNNIGDRLLLNFGNTANNIGIKKIKKTTSLLFMLKNESSKSMGRILAIIEFILLFNNIKWYRDYITIKLKHELKEAILKESEFEVTWLLYFICRHNIDIELKKIYQELRKENATDRTLGSCNLMKNPFIATLRGKKPGKGNITKPFEENLGGIEIYNSPKNMNNAYLIECLDIFDRDAI